MGSSNRILILDDEVSILDLFVAVLGDGAWTPGGLEGRLPTTVVLEDGPFAGTELLLATTAEDAGAHVRRAVQEGRPLQGGFFDLKLRDGVGGLDAIATCRELDPRLLVTVVTGYRDCSIDRINEIFEPDHGDEWDYLCKPFTRPEIRQKLRQVLESWHRRRRDERQAAEIGELNAQLRAWSAELEARVAQRTEELGDANAELERRNQRLQEVLEQLSATQARLVQHEKMSSLFQLSSGVAHEVSRPARFAHESLGELRLRVERLATLHERVSELSRPGPSTSPEVAELRDQLAEACRSSAAESVLHEADELIEDCLGATARVDRIVSSLRLFARPASQHAKAEPVEVGLRATLELIPEALRVRGRVELEVADGVPPIEVHGGELNQAWLALIVNALEACGDGGRVVVSASCSDGQVEVEITDDGPGMDRDVVERAMEPFFTTHASPANVGLGLSIAYGIIERHGGHVAIDSEPGGGTTVRVTLPSAFRVAAAS